LKEKINDFNDFSSWENKESQSGSIGITLKQMEKNGLPPKNKNVSKRGTTG
jgi:hypothetical protein